VEGLLEEIQQDEKITREDKEWDAMERNSFYLHGAALGAQALRTARGIAAAQGRLSDDHYVYQLAGRYVAVAASGGAYQSFEEAIQRADHIISAMAHSHNKRMSIEIAPHSAMDWKAHEGEPDIESGKMTLSITAKQKNALESIQNHSNAYLMFLSSHKAQNQQEVAAVIAQYWADIQGLEFFSLPVPLQQVIIDDFAKSANEIIVESNLLTYHDAADGRMTMALFRIVERRPLNSPQGAWAYGVRRLWGKSQNSQQAFNSHLDTNIIYDLDAVDEFIDPIIGNLAETTTLADPSKDQRHLESYKNWFFTLGFLRMVKGQIKEHYIAFLIAHEYAHLQRQIAAPHVGEEYEELLAELYTMATSSPLMAFARLINWADRGLVRGTLFLSMLFNSNENAGWIQQLADLAAQLYAIPEERDSLENRLSQAAISLIHQIEDQLPGGRVLRPESPFPRFNAARAA
jgi:hypothetical protein